MQEHIDSKLSLDPRLRFAKIVNLGTMQCFCVKGHSLFSWLDED